MKCRSSSLFMVLSLAFLAFAVGSGLKGCHKLLGVRESKEELLARLEVTSKREVIVRPAHHKLALPDVEQIDRAQTETEAVQPISMLGNPLLEFPPLGEHLGMVNGYVFHAFQKRFYGVQARVQRGSAGISIYGATRCEKLEQGSVYTVPCVFHQLIPIEAQNPARSRIAGEIAETLRKGLELHFQPWARYAVSFSGCPEGSFRTSFQFGMVEHEKYVSLRSPFSLSEEDAVGEMAAMSVCEGLDLFFTPEEILTLLRYLSVQ